MSNASTIRDIIYNHKRSWPTQIRILRESIVTDLTTGDKVVTVESDITIRRAVVLPNRKIKDFVYDLSFVAANKNFSYGGFFDKGVRNILIDAKDLRGLTVALNDAVIVGTRKCKCENVMYYEVNGRILAYLISVKDIGATADV